MNRSSLFLLLLGTVITITGCQSSEKQQTNHSTPDTLQTEIASVDWALLPFQKVDSANPILLPKSGTIFHCPIWKKDVQWEEHDVYNPTAVVRDGKVYMIYRAEDTVKVVKGTSRLGLAESSDGIHFTRLSQPVFYPDNDAMKQYEWMGGCEDPRVVEDSAGTYYMTYTAYDGKTARLCVASSKDLKKWKKHGLAFKEPKYKDMWSKSGSIVCKQQDSRMVATKINGKYWMYWGENGLLAHSDNLTDWTFVADEKGEPKAVVAKRSDTKLFDNGLVEPGPAAMLTDKGILLIYNGAAFRPKPQEGVEMYAGGQVLLDKNDPAKILARLDQPFIKPEKDYELVGQVNKVTFVEGLVFFRNKWFLYYGTADSKIAVAVKE
ncbi:glycoside hydrolase family 130 protein [Cytophagaceae bacterium YF14B1]|uniref:Glycoside hydrolase family 130 protein n=1 Tax=Xanthocytophaga flava TaxID=3048013 RepID=A0AAE3U6J1_9BACT|nr:glycoside hydrolase family 130 protein [Xanthocytophaga flavus]MDJ1480632.1 glycoside hydrolase family 130 protein [Xanthocytophaga flavus]